MPKSEIVKSKIKNLDELQRLIYTWKFKGFDIVFTNGCFDLLHKGHFHLLSNAADHNEKLIVGVNTDESVRKLKGDSRPIIDQESRALLLASMTFVDAVILFEDETPLNIIEAIQPDIIVKGGDYNESDIVGADIVKQNNGQIRIIDLIEGYATSKIEEKIRKAHR